MSETDTSRARLVGINHVALEVADLEEALDFYGALFEFDLRGRIGSAAFLDVGDQFLALVEADQSAGGEAAEATDDHRHFGLVVDDAAAVEGALAERGVEPLGTTGLDFHDPWGNRIQIVEYGEIQFTKAEHVLRGMGLPGLGKSESALTELRGKGMGPE
ncbi:VOC family protein [Halorarum salinum]|uniref:VOC family protein n=1 Tax=Halorarum salinum TaxID=2743089 RepID=A0A7D5Q9F7_9EURY|nr:VOC family protein [Halobaculum salinum]QLG61637.1 VOC family protein [Halobaculum salinum]